jgi:hypothetical protein
LYNLDQSVWLVSPMVWFFFDLATWHDASVPLLYLPKTPHKALLDGRVKGKVFGEERHTLLRDQEYH